MLPLTVTCPPFWTLSVPVPPPLRPTIRLVGRLGVPAARAEPAPVTVMVPVLPAAAPAETERAPFTRPPLLTVNVPVPELPTPSWAPRPRKLRTDPAPSTVTLPVEPLRALSAT